mgnify:CR=1 FL=1
MSKVLPVLHRQLLRLARGLDAYPLSKALLLAQPDAVFDRSRDAVVSLPKIKGAAGEWARLLSEFNGGEYYKPESSAAAAVRARPKLPRGSNSRHSFDVASAFGAASSRFGWNVASRMGVREGRPARSVVLGSIPGAVVASSAARRNPPPRRRSRHPSRGGR